MAHITGEEWEELQHGAELLADRAAAETLGEDMHLEAAVEWVREYARNNAVAPAMAKLAIEYLEVMDREGWITADL